MRWLYLMLAAALVCMTACSDSTDLPQDPELEVFIKTMARCANIERAYSGNPAMMRRELEEIEAGVEWQETVDHLLAAYGGDPDFWQSVYDEILERSRLPAQ